MKVVMELENPQKSHGKLEMVMENLGTVREFTLTGAKTVAVLPGLQSPSTLDAVRAPPP